MLRGKGLSVCNGVYSPVTTKMKYSFIIIRELLRYTLITPGFFIKHTWIILVEILKYTLTTPLELLRYIELVLRQNRYMEVVRWQLSVMIR